MKEGQPQETRLTDYQAPGYTTTATNLTFDLSDEATTVTSTLTIQRLDSEHSQLRLDGESLELLEVRIDGRTLAGNEYAVDAETLTLHDLGERHEVTIVTRIYPAMNTALEGLYRSNNLYCTQCEAQGFRKITYYQDRPDVLAKFKTTIIAAEDSFPTLLSNGNLIDEQKLSDGRRRVTWEDPFPKPSYLFALVAGDLAVIEDTFVTMNQREVSLQIYSEAHNIDQCHYAMDVLKRSMAWDEQRFGREYDLDVFMIVAVEDFNMGAMENKGLNIFNTSCVLASPDTATDAAYQRVEAVVAHEYFHNWSGNRVTCRDWFQLSLKEGFTVFRDAEFSSDMNSPDVKRIEDVTFLRAIQFAEDASPLAHPVRPQSYIEISNFYTTTIYEKGAEVVRMYRTLLGADKFRAGSDLYFERHDGSAVTTDDFAQAMAEVSGLDLTQFKLWYEQAGTPVLKVSEQFVDGELSLTIRQQCPATPGQDHKQAFHLPIEIGLLDQSGQTLSVYDLVIDADDDFEARDEGRSLMLSMRKAESTVRLSYLEHKPVVSFLRGFSAPVKVEYARDHSELSLLARHDRDGFVRWDALQTLWLDYFESPSTDRQAQLSQVLGELVQEILAVDGNAQTKLLAATMLSPPTENYLFEQLDHFQLEALLDSRDQLLDGLAHEHQAHWLALHKHFASDSNFRVDAEGMADRALANLGFAYAGRDLSGATLDEFVVSHYRGANNLTDRQAALTVACRHPTVSSAVREELLADFRARWQNEALVMDMWFSLQAQSGLYNVEQLTLLANDDLFDLRNPNRARALYGVFGMQNHRVFHAIDGRGYEFLADAIAHIDPLNPSLASRLTTPLTRWQRYDEPRQQLMRAQLTRLSQMPAISKDLFEIVGKSLN